MKTIAPRIASLIESGEGFRIQARYIPRLGAAFVMWACLVLLCAFLVICLKTGTIWPWATVVHEDGRRTLIDTILYYEHATREMPLDVILGIAIGGCAFFAFPPSARRGGFEGAGVRQVLTLGLLTVSLCAVILVGTASHGGVTLVFHELLQNRTRFGVPSEFGSHWRYHLLERLSVILMCIGLAGTLRMLGEGRRQIDGRVGLIIAIASIGAYLLLTIIFTRGWFAFGQPFRDSRYLGHQAREVLTHALVTVPIAWGVCMLALTNREKGVSPRKLAQSSPFSLVIVSTTIAGVAGLLLAVYLLVAAAMAGAVAQGQTTDLATLIFPHFFEHSFTYVLVIAFARFTYEVCCLRARGHS